MMAYNGGLEDAQNWPFSVRYTASPYRKSKFPVDPPALVSPTVENPSAHWPNLTQNGRSSGGGGNSSSSNNSVNNNHINGHFHGNGSSSYPFQYVNAGVVAVGSGAGGGGSSSSSTGTFQLSSHHHSRRHFYNNGEDDYDDGGGCLSTNGHHPESHHYSIAGSDRHHHNHSSHHNHYGLPVPHSVGGGSGGGGGGIDSNFFMRYPGGRHFGQNCAYLNSDPNHHDVNQVEGILDEGYIEDLKQPYNNGTNNKLLLLGSKGFGAGSDNNNSDYDPYSYVYDSKIQEDLSVTSVLCCAGGGGGGSGSVGGERDSASIVSMPMQYSASSMLGHSRNGSGGTGTGNGNCSSENEYEEISDVARYMNSTSNSGSSAGGGGGGSGGGISGGPRHFKSFSSTDDILAEVVQVQQRHDRVLDQLNLEVENLLISSSNDIVEGCSRNSCDGGGGGGGRVGAHLDKMSSLSLNGIYQECYCDAIPSLPQFGGTLNSGVLRGSGGGGRAGGLPQLNSLSSSSSRDSCCCCGSKDDGEDANSLGCAESLTEAGQGMVGRSRRSSSLTLTGLISPHHPHGKGQDLYQPLRRNGSLTSSGKQAAASVASTGAGANLLSARQDDDDDGGCCISGVIPASSTGSTMSRKKKLERQEQTTGNSNSKLTLKEESDRKLMLTSHHHPHHHLLLHHHHPHHQQQHPHPYHSPHHHHHHHHHHQFHQHIFPTTAALPAAKTLTDKQGVAEGWKSRHHRSYSLIPHWKIREHLRRLPFLRQNNKLKKTEGSSGPTSSSGPISSSGPDLSLTNNCCSNNNKKKMMMSGNAVLTSSKSIPAATTVVPSMRSNNRSSSMDELRATGPEEHWYSADSDTEPDSLTAIQESCPIGLINGGGNNGSGGCPNSTSSPLGNTISSSIGPRVGSTTAGGGVIAGSVGAENGSRVDLGSGIPEAPKAPKFRRATGLKDKWRESWSSTKTLSKPNMDEENKLLRWFSLRKNQANLEPPGSRHSTLPLLSEEDLKRISYIEDEEGYWPRRTVQPPALPPPPSDLSPDKITRRHIVAAIVHSENSYVAALQRLVNEYKKPLERSHPAILSHSKISSIFHRVPEILQCHSLFRIALAECVRRWDVDEKIGDVFSASFSKSLVLDVYSEFINNFGLAMETAKVEARRKSAFADFLKVKQMTAHDRLSLFGLMVKPVQRFPQFILLLQDLLKHTPKDHRDRISLQLALTQLESLAAMLNERKRESEQYQAFRETIKSIGGGKFVLLRSVADDPNRILLRQDVVTQLEFDNSGAAVAKSKSRKLLLLNDMLICVALSQSGSTSAEQQSSSSLSSSTAGPPGGSGGDMNSNGPNGGSNKVEKSVFKWSYPVRDVEVEDISISPTMSRIVHGGGASSSANSGGGGGNSRNGSFKTGNHGTTSSGPNSLPEEVPPTSMSLLEEMQSLMHDYEVLSRILTLVSSLKSQYEGLTEASVKELMLEIQHQIRCRDEQISYFDSSCLTLLLGTGNNRDKVVFQMQSPAARNEWIEELRLAQLALDPNNSPSWDIPSESPYPHHKLPLFVRSLTLTKSPNKATVKCGCYFTHTFVSPTGRSKILDYLWVSSTDGMSSHVTAFRAQQNALKEVSSFDLVEEKINDLLFVSGYVWVATKSRKIMVFDPSDPDKGSVSSYLLSDSVLKLTQFEGNIYAGLADGTLAVFTEQNPQLLKPKHLIKVGEDRVRSVFGSRDHVYAACGNAVVSIDIKTHTIERNVVLNHHNGPIAHMACSGVGLWITTQDSGTVCLYHLESLKHLQDVSVAPSVFRTVRDSFRRQEGCHVTCLTAHKGWLWIGTNLGVILTIPLPRLEGVPIISTGKANVSFHGYSGPVSFLMPLTKPAVSSSGTSSSSSANRHRQIEVTPPTPTLAESLPEKLVSPPAGKPEDSQQEIIVKSSKTSLDENHVNETKESGSSDSSNNNSLSQSGELKESDGGNNSQSSSVSLTRTLSDTGSVGENSVSSKTLVVLRKKNSRDSVFLRNCKTLPRGGPLPASLRFSIDSDVYGLYGNLINVRGLEDEGRFVDPLYDALRRSDPELVALDAKISTLDRRLKMRMSRPRSLDLSNWSVDSKISASSDESVGARNNSPADPVVSPQNNSSPVPPDVTNNNNAAGQGTTSTASKKTLAQRQKNKNKGPAERTVMVVVGGRGYINMRTQSPEHFVNTNSESTDSSKHVAHLTVWQMKT